MPLRALASWPDCEEGQLASWLGDSVGSEKDALESEEAEGDVLARDDRLALVLVEQGRSRSSSCVVTAQLEATLHNLLALEWAGPDSVGQGMVGFASREDMKYLHLSEDEDT